MKLRWNWRGKEGFRLRGERKKKRWTEAWLYRTLNESRRNS